MILKNLWRRKVRTALTMGGIAVGVAVIVALLILADALAGQFSTLMAAGGAELSLIQSGIADSSFSALDETIGQEIGDLPEVAWVSGMLIQIVPLEQRPFFILIGLDPAGEGLRHFRLVHGVTLQEPDEIMLGRMAADIFHKGLGEMLIIQGHVFRIAGIYETGSTFEDTGGVISLAEAQDLFKKPGQVSFFQVKVRPEILNRMDHLIQDLQARYPQITAYRTSDFGQNLPDIQNFQALAGAISLVGILAGGLGTLNTMSMSVFERKREIGTLRALGWRKSQVIGMILLESQVLSLLGGLAGIALGISLVALINLSPAFQGYLTFRIEPDTIAVGLIVAFGLGTLGGLYPAWSSASLEPSEALRYE
jgi:ABC-type antimicrobial peptide transport system permease subunit